MVIIEARQKLSTWRNLAHLSQEDFADKVGVDRSTVSLWENGHVLPSAKHRAKIEQVLGISFWEDVILPKQ